MDEQLLTGFAMTATAFANQFVFRATYSIVSGFHSATVIKFWGEPLLPGEGNKGLRGRAPKNLGFFGARIIGEDRHHSLHR